jgi:hypothetical protein
VNQSHRYLAVLRYKLTGRTARAPGSASTSQWVDPCRQRPAESRPRAGWREGLVRDLGEARLPIPQHPDEQQERAGVGILIMSPAGRTP